MMNRFLFSLLGPELYLRLVSRFFFWFLDMGFLKGKPEFWHHYFTPSLLPTGGYVLDIGANLGYYSRLFQRKVGAKGRVYAVEPVALFRRVLIRNTRNHQNIEIFPFALGSEDGKVIEMGIPGSHKNFRHGLTRILTSEDKEVKHTFKVEMRNPEKLFAEIDRLDFIKCDVEGYEIHIFPLLEKLITTYKPVIQIETSGRNRELIMEQLTENGYKAYRLNVDRLVEYKMGEYPLDLIFVHADREIQYSHLINN
jgi:FkbM family methyltransferase